MKRKRLPIWANNILLLFFSIIICALALCITPDGIIPFLDTASTQPLLYVMNFLPIFLVVFLFYALFNNIFFAASLGSFIILSLSYANHLKTIYRSDPLVPFDVLQIKEAFFAVVDFDIKSNTGLILLAVGLILLITIIGIFLKGPKCSAKKYFLRLFIAILSLFLAFQIGYNTNHSSSFSIYDSFDHKNMGRIEAYSQLGFPYMFTFNFNTYVFQKPDDYDRSTVARWEKGQINDAAEASSAAGVKPNVIMIMCEAFSDISDDPVFNFGEENNPLRNYHTVIASERSLSGHIIVSNYGAGTANTEFDVMTGVQTKQIADNSIPFYCLRHSMTSLASIFSDQGYDTMFTHPGHSWYYDRDTVYKLLGFEELYFENDNAYVNGEKTGTLVTDKTLGNFVIDYYKEQNKADDEPLFTFAVTIENHMPYTADRYGQIKDTITEVPLNTTLPEESYNNLSIYLDGVRAGDELIKQLTDFFESESEPCILVFWGDHLPSLGTQYSIYRELGMDVGLTDSNDAIIDTYKTPFFIWKNAAAVNEQSFNGINGKTHNLEINANELGALTLETAGFGNVDPYFNFLLEAVREGFPAVYGDVSRQPLNESQMEILKKMTCWGYYRTK